MRALSAFLLLLALCASAAAERTSAEGAYSLDELSRTIVPTGKMHCPKVEMTRYKGDTLRFHKPVYIYKDFQAPLQELESIAVEVATEVYGRAPRKIVHIGTYNCRRIRKIPDLLSEHGLGNAIDIEGFDFGPAASGDERARAPSRRLRRSFQVRVAKHWDNDKSAQHAVFLRRFTEVLLERDVFRVYLGPAYPGHQDHFHFDIAPYRLVSL